MTALLTLNAGSSSVKFAVYSAAAEPVLLTEGQVENLGPTARMIHAGVTLDIGAADHSAALNAILTAVEPVLAGNRVLGVGHRIVHGGIEFAAPTKLTPSVRKRLAALNPLAPLHQPHNLKMVDAAKAVFPDAEQVGCFDTAFHHGHPWVNDTFALPRKYYDEGVRRYGFHGLSYDYITTKLAQDWPAFTHSKVIVAHLGNGASMCAIDDGRAIGSTMGFSALDGLPMGTRCGQLDPGVVLYLLESGMDPDDIKHILYYESGLKGLSGITHDMRTLLASDAPEAAQAIDYYVFRCRRELGAMAAIMGGVDAVVFCGGIGENAPEIRARICADMHFLGLHISEKANARNADKISAGATPVFVIPTNEELVIARAVAEALGLR